MGFSGQEQELSRHYGSFRGVDFSNDHTQVDPSRLAYLVNMYRDYKSGQGEALETMAGFRRRAIFARRPIITSDGIVQDGFIEEENKEVYGIFYFEGTYTDSSHKVLVHSGNKLYLWRNYPNSVNVAKISYITAPEPYEITELGDSSIKHFSQELPFVCGAVACLKKQGGEYIKMGLKYNKQNNTLEYYSSDISEGDYLEIEYYEGVIDDSDVLFTDMNLRKSTHFAFNNRLYILDGKNYLVFDGEKCHIVKDLAYVPTTYIDIIPGGTDANTGTEYEQRNILSPKFKHTFRADGETTEFYMNENELDSVDEVKVYGETRLASDYTVDLNEGKITFTTAPAKPVDAGYYEEYSGVEITASKVYHAVNGVSDNLTDITELISKCTLSATYDGKVFVAGNPDFHNHIFYCSFNSTGYADPTYFGILNKQQDGVGLSPITGLMCVSDTLMVLKADTQQDSAIYFHTGVDSGIDIQPRLYPSQQGLSGLGCVGACCNFLDDPIFISRLGVEGVGQLKIASERANEHRSRLIDAKLVNTDLSKAVVEEYGGYLCLLTDGQLFLGDSRQIYQDAAGHTQYEWYYEDGIGVYDNQYVEYKFASEIPDELQGGVTVEYEGEYLPLELADNVYYINNDVYKNLCGTTANEPNSEGDATSAVHSTIVQVDDGFGSTYELQVSFFIYDVINPYNGERISRHAYLCNMRGNYIGGIFRKAVTLRSMSDNLFFGCENGVICSFNFDLRDNDGLLPTSSYNYDNRTIVCGCATAMDNCGIPHLTKTTIKRSTVIKTKSFSSSSAKIKVRTNKKAYEQIARINSTSFSFDNMDFADFSFITSDQSLFSVKEKEKQWVEKQYYIYSDEYLRPFALYYISFRYRVAGRYKG